MAKLYYIVISAMSEVSETLDEKYDDMNKKFEKEYGIVGIIILSCSAFVKLLALCIGSHDILKTGHFGIMVIVTNMLSLTYSGLFIWSIVMNYLFLNVEHNLTDKQKKKFSCQHVIRSLT